MAIVERIEEHTRKIFPERFANEGTLRFRNEGPRDAYGRVTWTYTDVPIKLWIRVYRVRGIEGTELGALAEKNYIYTIPHYASFPRMPREDDLILYGGQTYKIVSVIPYTASGRNIIYTGIARVYKSGG